MLDDLQILEDFILEAVLYDKLVQAVIPVNSIFVVEISSNDQSKHKEYTARGTNNPKYRIFGTERKYTHEDEETEDEEKTLLESIVAIGRRADFTQDPNKNIDGLKY